MRPPFKVIHKYKNVKNVIGYKIYIFLGNDVEKNIKALLEKIRLLSFDASLDALSKSEMELLSDRFGKDWYHFFFNKHHLLKSKASMKRTAPRLEQLEKKFGKQWVEQHLRGAERVLRPVFVDKYADYIRQLFDSKGPDDGGMEDLKQHAGDATENIEDLDEDADLVRRGKYSVEDDELVFDAVNTDDMMTSLDDATSDINLDAINVDNDVIETNQQINDIMSSAKQSKLSEFDYDFRDDPFDTYHDNTEIHNVYEKIYVWKNFIFQDDTIYKIKTKICDSIRLNEERFPQNYLIPSRIYLWSEYFTTDMKLDKLMLGSKWIMKSELWSLDVEPKNDIQSYITLGSKSLQDMFYAYKKHNNRIRRDDDELMVIDEYTNYISNFEFYMADIYTQLNVGFNVDDDKAVNVINTFVRIYYPTVVTDFQDIVGYLQKEDSVAKTNEQKKMDLVYQSLRNDLILEREIMQLIEGVHIRKPQDMFSLPYIIQSVVHVSLKHKSEFDMLNLRRIFDNFVLDETYPFVQLQLSHEKPVRKILKNTYYDSNEKTREKATLLRNWVSSQSFGLTIKILANPAASSTEAERYLTINITESGKLQYKIQWQERDKTTVDKIASTFHFVNDLIGKIKRENDLDIEPPLPEQYRYVFINSMQHFKFTASKAKINHNDLSDFARLFFPYVSVVIDPKKRTSRDGKEKSGTPSSKWGTYLRFKRVSNYNDETRLGKRIIYYLKQYNVDEIMLVSIIANEFNLTEKEAKKKIIEVTERYPVRKRSNRAYRTLDTLPVFKPPGVAIEIQGKVVDNYKIKVIGSKNRYQMEEITTFVQKLLYLYQETYLEKKENRAQLLKKLEKMSNIAKRRYAVRDIIKKDETDSYYAIKRMRNIDPDRLGRRTDQDTSQYTRDCQNSGNVIRRPQQLVSESELVGVGYALNPESGLYEKTVVDKQTKEKVELVALRFETNNGPVYYICDPDINHERKYIGVLSKTNGYLPCCFKKNQLKSTNVAIRTKFMEALGLMTSNDNDQIVRGPQNLYIKHYSNKITNGRFYFLPELLDIFFNSIHDRVITKTNKLELAANGYFLLLGVNSTEYKFLRSISYAVNQSVNQIKNTVMQALKKDTSHRLFISLSDGDIASRFEKSSAFIRFIENSQKLEYNLMRDLIYHVYKINIIVLEYVPSRQDYQILCHNSISPENKYLLLLKEGCNYSIITEITKRSISEKSFESRMLHDHTDDVIRVVLDFYSKPCLTNAIGFTVQFLERNLRDGEAPKVQIIDDNFRVQYVITSMDRIFPVISSGVDPKYEVNTMTYLDTQLKPLEEQLKTFEGCEWITPLSLLQDDTGMVMAILARLRMKDSFIDHEVVVPVIPEAASDRYGLKLEDFVNTRGINDLTIEENRRYEVHRVKVHEEAYNLFRLELSSYISKQNLSGKFLKIIDAPKKTREEKRDQLIQLMEKLIPRFVHVPDEPLQTWLESRRKQILDYKLKNNRNLCAEVTKSIHCHRKRYTAPREWLAIFVIRVVIDLLEMDVNGKEVLRVDRYFVSDVVDSMTFTYRNNQLLLKGNEFNLQRIIDELYGEGILPNLGKKKTPTVVADAEGDTFKLVEFDTYYSQRIVPQNNTILRGLVNGFYYYLNMDTYDVDIINLRSKSTLQSNMVDYFKGKIVSWLSAYTESGDNTIPDLLDMDVNIDVLINLHKSYLNDRYWLLTVWAFHMLTHVPIYITDPINTTVFFCEDGKLYSGPATKSDVRGIHLRMSFNTYNNLPNDVEVLYYKTEL